jgi:hypothetical protein
VNIDDTPLGRMINQSLIQTAKLGSAYAVIPKPWIREWLSWFPRNERKGFHWFRYCGHKEHGWDTDKFPVVDGDVYICLIVVHVCEEEQNPHHVGHDVPPCPHEGPCGYERMINPTQVRGPALQGQ